MEVAAGHVYVDMNDAYFRTGLYLERAIHSTIALT